MAQSLNEALAAHPPYAPAARLADGEQLSVPLDSLDDNPYQPRTRVEASPLEELKASIRAQGLIQPIAVRPKGDGRFVIVAGHRRVAAFRALLAEGTEEAARAPYLAIPGVVKLAIDDAHLAAMAYVENKQREGLTLIEEGRALERMLEAGLASSTDELAAMTGQPPRTIQRLRRLARAPRFLASAVDAGLMVVLGVDEEGRERKELRRLELMPALQFLALYDFLQKAKPAGAEERTEGAVRRALAGHWSYRRIEEYVQDVVRGRASPEAEGPGAGVEAASGLAEGEGATSSAPSAAPAAALFSRTPRRFVIDLGLLAGASAEQRGDLRAALLEVLGEA